MLKNLVKKLWISGQLDWEGFDGALLEWRSIPREDGKLSLDQKELKNGLEQRRFELNKVNLQYDTRARNNNPLNVRDCVRIQNEISKLWGCQRIIHSIHDSGRSYVVLIGSRRYVRNRRYLRPIRSQQQSAIDFGSGVKHSPLKPTDPLPWRSNQMKKKIFRFT
ncbi:hypothetical protein TCAL_15164 [Tigriopus californicus]|uniref:DUF5641 domain-containing protein n=1 Tax=Tigriopus californicus TaxID=6832 RepID=A0A553NU15_TIGCA|nr:hypothetical protein TCAL_15164 [Tigriopus californicus]